MSRANHGFERPLPPRIVVIGDLNGQFEILVRLLKGLRLMDRRGIWRGGKGVLIQIGDTVNRGPGSRASMDLLLELKDQAREAGGDVIWLLGNHEVLSALRHEAYVTADEYLEFAEPSEIDQFYFERAEQMQRMLTSFPSDAVIEPLSGRLKAWEEANAPGRWAYRDAMGADGHYGDAIRSLPVAVRLGPLLFVHAGLNARWASLGIEGLTATARAEWAAEPVYYDDLKPDGLLRDPEGPLWHREYCLDDTPELKRELGDALDLTASTQMVIGHTRTDAVRLDAAGRPIVRFGGRLVMADVGIGDPGEPGAALVVHRGRIEAWSPGGSKSRLVEVKKR